RPQSLELGAGPQALLLLLVALLLPWLLPRERRREGWMLALFVWAQLLFWVVVPYARNRHVYANIRYLTPAIGTLFAALVAFGERRLPRGRWLEAAAVALLAQDMLQLHTELPFGVREAMVVADLVGAGLLFSTGARAFVVRHR